MGHIADLTDMEDGTVAIGWLDSGHPYRQGQVPPEFVVRLMEFAERWFDSVDALNWGVATGYHTCEFCGKAMGSGTCGVPWFGRLFYVPEPIGHYVEKHQYAPPLESITAVLDCPVPGTPDYAKAVSRFAEGGAPQDLTYVKCSAWRKHQSKSISHSFC
jgi:hypothetical protein